MTLLLTILAFWTVVGLVIACCLMESQTNSPLKFWTAMVLCGPFIWIIAIIGVINGKRGPR